MNCIDDDGDNNILLSWSLLHQQQLHFQTPRNRKKSHKIQNLHLKTHITTHQMTFKSLKPTFNLDLSSVFSLRMDWHTFLNCGTSYLRFHGNSLYSPSKHDQSQRLLSVNQSYNDMLIHRVSREDGLQSSSRKWTQYYSFRNDTICLEKIIGEFLFTYLHINMRRNKYMYMVERKIRKLCR